MKTIALSAASLFFALAGLASSSEPEVAPRPPVLSIVEGTPATPAVVSDPLSPRQEVTLRAAERLDQLEDRVAALRVSCDEIAACGVNYPAFDKFAELRAKVLRALADLQDPEIGFDAAERAVSTSLSELDLAIQALARTISELTPRRNS
jgi:hypothetical protein